MKSLKFITGLAMAISLLSSDYYSQASGFLTAHPTEPSYAKWGRLAMQQTKAKYPQAIIVDYKHVGGQIVSPTVKRETFKFWLRQGQREWGVIVAITFETESERIFSLTFTETDR